MASIIRIKRSSGTDKPSLLNWGELGYTTGIGSATNAAYQNKDRVYIGDDGTNVLTIGGRYYTAMMDHVPGTVANIAATNTRNLDKGVAALMSPLTNSGLGNELSLKVDQWNVDNLRLDTNTLSSTDTNGDIILDPNGTGEIVIPDDTYLALGDDKDSRIEYDENGTNSVQVTGAPWDFNTSVTISGQSFFGDIRIEDNVISTTPGSNDTLYIDPYPDGLSNEGTVIIKGNLQIDGTTTQVNSTQKTVNDPILHVGDVTSSRTVMQPVAVGVNTITFDSVVGINTGDVLSGSASLSTTGISTVTAVNTGTKIVTVDSNIITSGITTTSQLTITHAYDSNTDRGISFAFNIGSGLSNNKTGFFGMEDSSIATSTAGADNHGTHANDSRRWVYVPDASISNSVVSGTKGFLDIKGIYYQSGDYATGGVAFFDSTGLQRSTNAPASPVITSKQVLTAITKNTLALSGNITVAVGDLVVQDVTNAYGIVESLVNNGNSVNLVGVEGTFNTSNNLRRENGTTGNGATINLGANPTTVSVIYTNKPHWTSTLDGGTF